MTGARKFLMLHLLGPDVLPVGDLGIRKIVMRLYELDELPAPEQLLRIAEPWRPRRTFACLYLWEAFDRLRSRHGSLFASSP